MRVTSDAGSGSELLVGENDRRCSGCHRVSDHDRFVTTTHKVCQVVSPGVEEGCTTVSERNWCPIAAGAKETLLGGQKARGGTEVGEQQQTAQMLQMLARHAKRDEA